MIDRWYKNSIKTQNQLNIVTYAGIFMNEIINLNECSGGTKIEIQLIAKFKTVYYQTP